MTSDFKCVHCQGNMEDVDLENFDKRLVPPHVRDGLEAIKVCGECGFVVFYVDECASCSEPEHPGCEPEPPTMPEWTCYGEGEEKKPH